MKRIIINILCYVVQFIVLGIWFYFIYLVTKDVKGEQAEGMAPGIVLTSLFVVFQSWMLRDWINNKLTNIKLTKRFKRNAKTNRNNWTDISDFM